MPATYVRRESPGQRVEAGQSLVEFALGLTILILLILGIVDFSRMAYAKNALASAAREGARYATVHPDATSSQIAAVAKGLLAGLDTAAMNVTLSWPDADHVQVEVTYTFHPTSPWIGWFVDGGSGKGVVLTGRSLMWKERG